MSRRKSSSSRRKPIRIVPLHVAEDKAGDLTSRASPPQLTYRNGPLLQNVEVFTIFWGTGWQRSPAGNLVPQINDFFNGILSSSLMDQLAEYSVPGKAIARGKFVGTVSMTTPRLQRSVSDAATENAKDAARLAIERSEAWTKSALLHLYPARDGRGPGWERFLQVLLRISQ